VTAGTAASPATVAATQAAIAHATPEILGEPIVPLYSPVDEQMQKNVIELAEVNPAAIAEIIQIWLNEDEK
jgi:flagellar biosynthesis/type III secretory pathway M-ring protein FliF/YscJ